MITISITESSKQVIFGIPEFIKITIGGTPNALVLYTLDGSPVDPTGVSATTLLMEHAPGDSLHGTIFLPTDKTILDLNILAIGVLSNDTATFYRRYGLEPHITDQSGVKTTKVITRGITNTASANIATDGSIIANDGYTEGSTTLSSFTQDGYDGYADNSFIALSGTLVGNKVSPFDHIDGYITGNDGNLDGYSTSALTPEQGLSHLKFSDRGSIFEDDGNGKVSNDNLPNIDPRSSKVFDSEGRQIEVVPIEDYPDNGYTIDVDANNIDDNFDNTNDDPTTNFTSGGIFNPRAQFIEMDGRQDGYINGQPILPGDRVILNKPFGEIRYLEKREDSGVPITTTTGYVSGGFSSMIVDYVREQVAFYYFDHRDLRWICSIQKINPPKDELVARRNGVVVGWNFRWITGRRVFLPG